MYLGNRTATMSDPYWLAVNVVHRIVEHVLSRTLQFVSHSLACVSWFDQLAVFFVWNGGNQKQLSKIRNHVTVFVIFTDILGWTISNVKYSVFLNIDPINNSLANDTWTLSQWHVNIAFIDVRRIWMRKNFNVNGIIVFRNCVFNARIQKWNDGHFEFGYFSFILK